MSGNITKSWFRKLIEYLPRKGLKLYPQSAGPENGFALVTVIIILTIMGISAGIAGVFSVQINSSRHERISRDQLEVLKEAITGNPRIRVNEGRADFGFCGNMGGVPASLEELYIRGSQPAYVYNAVKRVGAGWNGPYIDPFIIEYIDNLKKDPFGNDYVYSTNQPDRADGEEVVARITSKGADDILGNSDDRYVEILKGEVFSTVTGKVISPDGFEVENAYITINKPVDGVLTTTQFDRTDSSGNYSFENVPFGINSIEVEADESTGTGIDGLVYVQGTAAATSGDGESGGQNNTVDFMISNLGSDNIIVKYITAEYTTGEIFSDVRWRAENAKVENPDNPDPLFDPTYVTVWEPAQNEDLGGSGEKKEFSVVKPMSSLRGKTLAATTEILHVDEATVTAQTRILGLGAGAGGQVSIRLFDFKNPMGGGNPGMVGVDFTIILETTTGDTYTMSFVTHGE